MARTSLHTAGFTAPGRREENEDAFAIVGLGDGSWAASVADGMGGHAYGSAASEAAVSAFRDSVSVSRADARDALAQAFASAAEAVSAKTRELDSQDLGTTFVAAIVDARGSGWLAHAGDSAAVLVTRGGVRRLTLDHSFVAEQMRLGNLSELESHTHPLRNAVTRALGSAAVSPDWNEVRTDEPCVLLLATDGVLKFVGDEEMLGIVNQSRDADEAVRRLVLQAIRNGGDDNATAVAIALGGWRWARSRRRPLVVLLALLAAALVASLFLVGRAHGQTVTAVSGNAITIGAGERHGVRVEMTGKLCGKQSIGGKSIEVCPAAFQIRAVNRDSSSAAITRGQGAQVQVGFQAVFDQRLVRESVKPSKKKAAAPAAPPPPPDPVALLADAEAAFDRGDADHALDLFRRVLKMMPEEEYVARRAAAAAQLVAPPARPPRARGKEVSLLLTELAEATRSANADLEKSTARRVLEFEPENATAQAIRARSRVAAWQRARNEASPWNRVAAWREHLAAFVNDAPAVAELERQTAGASAALSALATKSCDEVIAEVNAIPAGARRERWFRVALQQSAASWSCTFGGLSAQPAMPELELAPLRLRQTRPMPGAAYEISALGGSGSVRKTLIDKERRCAASEPCDHELLIAVGEQYQFNVSGGSFRNRSEPVTVVGTPAPLVLCLAQKMTRSAIETCAAPRAK
jgi:PPM family protein phosphatase